MASRIVDRIKSNTRLLPVLFMVASAFLGAHSVNAVVEATLLHPVYQTKPDATVPPAEPESRVPQRTHQQFVRDIMSSGLFPLPSASMDITSNRTASASAGPPLEAAKKVALIGIVMGGTGHLSLIHI